jgi:hypothetical protein
MHVEARHLFASKIMSDISPMRCFGAAAWRVKIQPFFSERAAWQFAGVGKTSLTP